MILNTPPTGTRRAHRRAAIRTYIAVLFAHVLVLSAGHDAAAQGRFKLQRSQRVSTPFIFQLYAGYNGMTNPSDKLQDMVENSGHTSWGGVMLGMQGFIPLDTLVWPIWIGVDAYYQRIAKRDMYTKGVTYVSDGSKVRLDENINAWGGNIVIRIDFMRRIALILGGGAQYMNSKHDATSPVKGDFAPVTVPTGLAALDLALLVYDHGSIDVTFRAMKGFHDMGSLQVDSVLDFTLNF